MIKFYSKYVSLLQTIEKEILETMWISNKLEGNPWNDVNIKRNERSLDGGRSSIKSLTDRNSKEVICTALKP